VVAQNQNTLIDAASDGNTYGRYNGTWKNLAAGGAGSLPFLPLTGGTVTGQVNIGTGGSGAYTAPLLNLNGAAGAAKAIYWQNNSTTRWTLQTDASDNMALYAFDASGGFLGTPVLFSQSSQIAGFNYQIHLQNSQATPAGGVTGLWCDSTNTGSNLVNGHKLTYFSSAGGGGTYLFDIGFTVLSLFNPTPTNITLPAPSYDGMWVVAQSPNDTAHSWALNGAEFDVVNRGPDSGWMRDRTSLRPTGGILMCAVNTVFGGQAGEGKNATFAYTVANSGANNSTGFPVKFYNGLMIEPDSIVGLTGRGIYATGDITSIASQRPYGPMQLDGTWLHGIDHTLATYMDGAAQTMLAGQALRWITGTTASPTATTTLNGSAAQLTANVPVVVGSGTGTQFVALNGATGQPNGIYWQANGSNRWRLNTDATDNLFLYAYNSSGTFVGSVLAIASSLFQVQVDCYLGRVGFNGATPGAKPTVTGAKGSNAALASLLTALASYGLITDSSTA
jgi:hypothetical protein